MRKKKKKEWAAKLFFQIHCSFVISITLNNQPEITTFHALIIIANY